MPSCTLEDQNWAWKQIFAEQSPDLTRNFFISYTRTTKLEKKKTHWSSNPTSVIKAQQCISSSGSWNINSKIGADVWHKHHYQLLQKKIRVLFVLKKKKKLGILSRNLESTSKSEVSPYLSSWLQLQANYQHHRCEHSHE